MTTGPTKEEYALAAKAAGYEVIVAPSHNCFFLYVDRKWWKPLDEWNPRESNADAFRLQSDLIKKSGNTVHLHYDAVAKEWFAWMSLSTMPSTGKAKTPNEALFNLAVEVGRSMP